MGALSGNRTVNKDSALRRTLIFCVFFLVVSLTSVSPPIVAQGLTDLPKIPYVFEVVARSGVPLDGAGPFVAFGKGPSINDEGSFIEWRVPCTAGSTIEAGFSVPPF